MIANPNDGNTPKVEQAVPKISVSAAGLITATAEQQEGYVPGGTKSATHQLTTQGAKTVTPGRTAQSAVATGYYTTGEVQVAGDSNLVPENIAEGMSIFGVTGTHSGKAETVTVKINFSGSKSIQLVDSSFVFKDIDSEQTIEIAKYSIVIVYADMYDSARFSPSSAAIYKDQIFTGTNLSYSIYQITGDCSVS